MFDTVTRPIIEFFTKWLERFYELLDPTVVIARMLLWVVSQLPQQSTAILTVANDIERGVLYVIAYVRVLDYFINLPVLYAVIGVMLAVETGLLALRIWRFILSMIPLA